MVDKSHSRFWRRVARLVTGNEATSAAPVARTPADLAVQPPSDTVQTFITRLREKVSAGGVLTAGTIHVINLDRVRESMAAQGRWEALADRVATLCGTVIRRHLDSVDMMLPLAGPAFLITFGRLKSVDARAKCTLIAQEIEQRLSGWDPAFQQAKVQAGVVRLDGGEVAVESLDLLAEIGRLAAQAERTEVGGTREPPPAKAGENSPPTAQADEPLASAARDVYAFGNPWLVEIGSTAERNDGEWFYEPTAGLPPGLSFTYVPMWHTRRRVVGTHLCLPTVALNRSQMLVGDAIYAAAPPLLVCEIDIHLLNHVSNDLQTLLSAGKHTLLGVPVHFETLARSRERRRYLAACARMPEETKRYMSVELVDLPEGAPAGRLAKLLAYLRPFARILNVRTSLGHAQFEPLAAAKAFAVGVALGREERSEGEVMARMNVFTAAAERAGLETYAFELRSRSLVSAALGAGFGYVSGSAVGPSMDVPNPAYRFAAADLYADILR